MLKYLLVDEFKRLANVADAFMFFITFTFVN